MKQKLLLLLAVLPTILLPACQDGDNITVVLPKDELSLALDKSVVEATATAGTYTVEVSGNVAWSATVKESADGDSWFRLSGMSGEGDGTITIEVDENTSIERLTALIEVKGGVIEKQFRIVQEQGTLTIGVSPSHIPASILTATYNIEVTGNGPWSVEAEELPWCRFSPSSGFGDATITVELNDNYTPGIRETTLAVVSGDIRHTVAIEQDHLIWATTNVAERGTFAPNPGAWGMYYQFNSAEASDPDLDYEEDWPDVIKDDCDWDLINNNPCPAGWRLPRHVELQGLFDSTPKDLDNEKYTGRWTMENFGSGPVQGCWFGPDSNDATPDEPGSAIFLPATGYRWTSGALYMQGHSGSYWAIEQSDEWGPTYAFDLSFRLEDSVVTNGGTKAAGHPVRCVSGVDLD